MYIVSNRACMHVALVPVSGVPPILTDESWQLVG